MKEIRTTMGYCKDCKTMQLFPIEKPRECPLCNRTRKGAVSALDRIKGIGQLPLDLDGKQDKTGSHEAHTGFNK